jgi:PAS domain S-box-containing protein
MDFPDSIYSEFKKSTGKRSVENNDLKGNGSKNRNSGQAVFNIGYSEELGNLIVENSHDGIIIIGDSYKIEYVNKRLSELTGYCNDDILGKDFRDFLNIINKDDVLNRYNKRLEGNNLDNAYELELITSDNDRKIFEVRSSVFKDSAGNTKTLSQFKDITEQKAAEEALKQSEIKFRSIVENSHLGILIVNSDFQFEYANNQLCKILNTTREKLEGNDFRKYLSKESLDIVVERYLKRQRGDDVPSEYRVNLITEDGIERIAKLTSTVVNYLGQRKTIAQLLDITEKVNKHKVEKVILNISQAVNEVKNLNEFLGIVRQELSTILDTTNFYVALYDKNSDTYTFPYHVDEYDSIDEITQLELKDSLTDYVRRNNKATLVNSETQVKLEEQGEIKGIVGADCPIWLGAPLVVDNQVVGTICLQNYHNGSAYNESDLELLKIVSENVSSAIWKKKVVDKLAESERRYRDFISRSSEGIYRIDFETHISIDTPPMEQVHRIINEGLIGECNNAFAKMYGYDSYKDIIGKKLNVFYGDTVVEENLQANLQFIENNYKITDVETHEYSAEGERLVILNNSIGIVKNGFLTNIWGIQKNITERKNFELILKEIAEGITSSIGDSFFKSIVQFLCETLKVDYAYIAQLSNDRKFARSLAFWGENRPLENFEYQLDDSPTKTVLQNGKTTLFDNLSEEYPNDHFINNLNIKNYLARPLVNSNGKTSGIMVILSKDRIEDLEFKKSVLEIFATRCSAEIERLEYLKELVAAKDEAEKSNSLKSDFLAQMSHEIRTPVNTILSFTSLIKESLENQLDNDLKDSFKIIENGGSRLIRTIDLILNVSQIQSGNLTISPIELDIVKILKDLVSEFSRTAKKESLDLIFESKHKSLRIFGDNYTITQIFANLIHNSIKYTPKGFIKIIVEAKKGKEIIVKVQDTGVGMSSDFLTQLFDPFSQEETGYTRKFEGTGLGLTLVRKYCELNNASISVKSTKDKGSTFIVKFKPR